MKQTLAYLIIVILSSSMYVNAQELVVTGQVFGFNKVLPSTSIALKGDSTSHTKSDKDGKYVLNLSSTGNDTLIFSHTGYENLEVALKNQQATTIVLTELNSNHNKVVQVYYSEMNSVLPVEIPNGYEGDNSIEIPNGYRANKDYSVEIPNADSKDKGISSLKLLPNVLPPRKE